ncbi:MAG: pyruvate carboxyltransferase [Methanomassiliicoccales archaeon]|nr:pyruvate carboxyltransferase [Methanomassiliicoccales archaeon]
MKWKSEDYWVSHYNFRKSLDLPRVKFHDTTFRDGEQQPGVVFTSEEKLKIGTMMSEIGIDRIEGGMPLVSEDDRKAVKMLANAGLDAEIFAFTRCMKEDVETSVACDVDGVIMEVPSSGHLIGDAYEWSEEKAKQLAVEATAYAHDHGLYVSFFCIDLSRADADWALDIIGAVAEEGHMDALNVVDTFGALSPEGMTELVTMLKNAFSVPIEVHTHNDFGLAVANTIAAVKAGAEVVHTTVNGLGERSGNASFEETAMCLKVLYGQEIDLDFSRFKELSDAVEKASGVKKAPNKPIVGNELFSIESGIVAGWWKTLEKKNKALTMFPYHWTLVGQDPPRIVLGKKSGLASILYWAEKLGIELSEEKARKILIEVKNTSIRKKGLLTEKEFRAIVEKVQ